CDASAAVVARNAEAREAEALHDLDLILRHRALGIIGVRRSSFGLARVPIAPQVGADDDEALRKFWRDPVPHNVRLRISMQEQQGWTASTDDQMDLGAGSANASRVEPGEKVRHGSGSNRSRYSVAPPLGARCSRN